MKHLRAAFFTIFVCLAFAGAGLMIPFDNTAHAQVRIYYGNSDNGTRPAYTLQNRKTSYQRRVERNEKRSERQQRRQAQRSREAASVAASQGNQWWQSGDQSRTILGNNDGEGGEAGNIENPNSSGHNAGQQQSQGQSNGQQIYIRPPLTQTPPRLWNSN